MQKIRRFLLISLLLLFVIVAVIFSIGLWNGSGSPLDFLAGQFEPEPRRLDRTISLSGGQAAPYAVEVTVNSSHPIAEVSPNYLSFSIDASQVTGGKWWNPDAQGKEMGSGTVHAPLYDFNRPRLDMLTQALSPAYLRVGGSESDKIFYDLESAGSTAPPPPPGYKSVLTRQQWDSLNAYAQRNNLEVVFTLNAGPGTRQTSQDWDSKNAEELIAYTAQQGYPVKVWELGNELNIFWFVHGFSAQIPTRQYQQDLQAARALIGKDMPQARLGGQGSAIWPVLGEPLSLFYGFMPRYLEQSGSLVDQVSWHYYPQQSRRGPIASRRAYPSRLLDPKNLDEAGLWADRIRSWRDAYAPGKPIWLGETGNAQFGGEPGLSDVYLGGLWWLDELGLLAQKDTQVVVRQTLSGMNYGMIEDETLIPRPDYWNSLLWKRLMGAQVYEVNVKGENGAKLRAYAHGGNATAAPSAPQGSVTVLLINIDPQKNASVQVKGIAAQTARLYEITSADIFGQVIQVNGQDLKINLQGQLPDLTSLARTVSPGAEITIHPLSYTFIQFVP
jgi:heparanase 1